MLQTCKLSTKFIGKFNNGWITNENNGTIRLNDYQQSQDVSNLS